MTNGDNARPLMEEIVLAISEYYDWESSKTREVEALAFTEEDLQIYTGTYKLKGTDKPSAEITVKDGNLFLIKSGSTTGYSLFAVDSLKFIDPRTDNKFLFKKANNKETSSFILNEQMEFLKMK